MNNTYKPFDVNVKGFAGMTEEELDAFWEAQKEHFLRYGSRVNFDPVVVVYDSRYIKLVKRNHSRKKIRKR